jgi:hypothetical protein
MHSPMRLVSHVAAPVALLAALVVGATAVPAAKAPAGPRVGGCPVFPATNAWNRDVSKDPVDPRSAVYLRSIGLDGHLHADFGGNGQYGIPYSVVPKTQKRVRMRFTDYPTESDKGPYPIPANARIEGGNSSDGDRHVLVAQAGTCKLFELYNAHRAGSGWNASNGAVFDLRSNKLRPAGWTSADAAGLPILAGLARYDEVRAGAIDHALRVTVQNTQKGYVSPARHFASSDSNPSLPPMGLRLRLKASYPLGGFHGQALIIMRALKRYGLMVADNGSNWFITGASDRRWNDDDLDQLKSVPGSAFQVVKHGPISRATG